MTESLHIKLFTQVGYSWDPCIRFLGNSPRAFSKSYSSYVNFEVKRFQDEATLLRVVLFVILQKLATSRCILPFQ